MAARAIDWAITGGDHIDQKISVKFVAVPFIKNDALSSVLIAYVRMRNEKHKHKIIVINRSYIIINICLISDILQKYNHFLAEMLGDSIFFRT